MSEDHLHSTMNPEPISNARNSSPDRDEDHHDAMEVDSGLSMAVDTSPGDDTEETMPSSPPNQSHDLDPTSPATPISSSTPAPAPALSSREPPAFDEDTERPRQRRRFHVTVEEETDAEIRSGPNADGANVDDGTTVLESAPPRMSELSITTPPAVEHQQGPMLDIVQDSSAPVPTVPASPNQGNQSPHLNTIPLPDVPPPPNPNAPPDPVMEAARRLTSPTPNATPDQMQADLALLAPYIAVQAMAAAFPMGGRPPPAGGGGGGNNAANAPTDGQGPTPNEGNNGAPPPLPPFPLLPPFLFGGSGELPADPKRAERLANGLKVAEDGLLKRWKAVCGDEGAVCAVCYSELLEEPGIEKEKDEQEKEKAEGESEAQEQMNEDAHEQALRDALKRREAMEKLEKEEKERKLETAVLAFPCGHVFHRTCLLPWLSRHTTCPTCRFDIDPKSDTLNLPADEGLPFPNFRDFFTVGPVLRVPRVQAPGGPTPGTRNNRNNTQDQTGPNEAPRSDAEAAPNASGGRGNNTDPPSMTEMFEILFGPLLHSVGIPPPRQPSDTRTGQAEGARPVPTSIPVSTAESDDDEPPPLITDPPTTSTSATSYSTPQAPPPVPPPSRRPAPSRRAEARRSPVEDRDRPVAMFGRLAPRRPPQPITPSWMRPTRPAPTPAPAPAPAAAATESSSASVSTAPEPSSSTADSSAPAGISVPASTQPQPNESPRHGLGQLRAIVSNLLPRRISTSSRASGAPSVRSARSAASAASTSTIQNSQPSQGPLSPRTGIRAILHGPTSLLRDLTSGRRPGSGNRSRASTSSATIPSLESESGDETTFSEDGIDSDSDNDMPALEPIEGRRPRIPTPTPAPIDASGNDNAPTHENQQEAGTNEQPQPGGRAANQDMLGDIITLRIDLGHADGRDETIIVPLVFSPGGRAGANAQPSDAPPAPQQPRVPPPQKKWTPPEAVKTFRQVVEEKEREIGWRCDDPACLLGPADDEEPSDEPHTIKLRYPIMRSIAPEGLVRHQKNEDGIRVYADGEDVRVNGENPVCEHTLHAECLVTSARVNGWSPPHNADPHSRVTLRCPVCRHEGTVERQVWDAGMEAEAVELN